MMNKTEVSLNELKLVGIFVRTSNKAEMDPNLAKIPGNFNRYFSNGLFDKILNRKSPFVTYSVYTEYESNEFGEYTHFIGEEVLSFEAQDLSLFKTLTVPENKYTKFTTNKGEMPKIVIETWQKIWQMNEIEMQGKRNYIADFEIYDQRAIDPQNAEVDIYIGKK